MNKRFIALAQDLKPKKFPLENELDSISNEVLEAHRDTLYHNYVKNYNKMVSVLDKTNFSKIKDDIPNSQFAQIKRRITWAANGAYLHELYFGNLGGKSSPGKCTLQLIKKDFKTLNNFEDNFISTAFVPVSGWAVCGYSLYDKKTSIAAIESHHDNCPIGFIPLLVVDMWEHAYWKDHLSDKKEYVRLSWEDINWEVVEKRCKMIEQIFEKL